MPNALSLGQNRAEYSRRFVVLSAAIRGLPFERVFPRQHR